MTPPLHDAHCHVVEPTLAAAGLVSAVVNGTCPDDWGEVAALAAREPLVRPAYGVHPWRLGVAPDGWLDALRARLLAEPAASIGEIGLDRGEHASAPVPAQVAALHAQLALAVELGRAATLHCIRAWGPLLDALDAAPALPAGLLVHGFAGSAEVARELLRRGAVLGFGATLVGRPSATAFRDLPGDRIVVETDAPRAAPSALPGAYAALAELRDVPLAELVDEVDATVRRLFG